VDLVEVLVVVDEDSRRYLQIELPGDLGDEIQRQRRIFPTGPHDGRILVLFESSPRNVYRLLDFVLDAWVVFRRFVFAFGVIDVDVCRELFLICHAVITYN